MIAKDSSDKTEKALERLHAIAAGQEDALAFFRALELYVKYALETPLLKGIFDKQIRERNIRYEKIEEIEKAAEEEMRAAKNKIMDIIRTSSIDSSLFERHSTFPKPPYNDLIAELEAYENKEMRRSGFYSDNMQVYLFDIATNLQKMGYGGELKDFHVSQNAYTDYYQRIKGTSGYWFAGNDSGSFIFSKKWPERFEQEIILERERSLKPWGSFELLFQFKSSYDAVLENMSFWEISDEESAFGHAFRAEDIMEIAFMAEDLQHLMGQTRPDSPRKFKGAFSPELDRLSMPTFKAALQIVHNTFLQALENDSAGEQQLTVPRSKTRKDIFIENESLCFGTTKVPIERGQKAMIQLLLANARIERNDTLSNSGKDADIETLQKVGGYRDDSAFRDGLKRLRAKLKKGNFPATIDSIGTGKYQMVIKYQ